MKIAIVLNILLIDLKNGFRYAVHAKVPPTIEDYYQQCGRAGRDGQESICCMFYSPTDKTALLRMFHQQNLIEKQTKHLTDLIILLEDLVQCRHKNIMIYYGEERDGFMCGRSCDNCRNRGHFVVTDGSPDALKVVQAVMELTGKEITFNNLKLFLAGSNQKSIKEKKFRHLVHIWLFKETVHSGNVTSKIFKFANLSKCFK